MMQLLEPSSYLLDSHDSKIVWELKIGSNNENGYKRKT
jgi:hypothetical protein